MFKPADMKKLRITGCNKDVQGLISALHEAGGVQIERSTLLEFDAGKPQKQLGEVTEQVLRMGAIQRVLTPQENPAMEKNLPYDQLLREAKGITIDARLSQLTNELEGIRREETDLRGVHRLVGYFGQFGLDASILHSNYLKVVAGKIPDKRLADVKRAIGLLSSDNKVYTSKLTKLESNLVAVLSKDTEEKAREFLSKAGFAEEELPDLKGSTGSEALLKGSLEKKLAALEKRQTAIKEEINQLSRKYWGKVQALSEMLEIEKQRAEVTSQFGQTKELFSFEAWCLAKEYDKIRKLVEDTSKGRAIIEEMHAGHDDKIPTVLTNPKILSPFEFLITFTATPKQNELDPTILFSVFFPLFYGMMLGDVGYGLLSLLISLWILKNVKSDLLQPIARVWAICSVPTIVFGFIYDEYLGFEHHQILGFSLYQGVHRMESVPLLLGISILLGLFHVLLGYTLGAYNAFKHHHTLHGMAKISWIIFLLGASTLVVSQMFHAFEAPVTIIGGLMVLALAVIAKAEGINGIVEIPSAFGNVLSYSRIVAIGLSSVVIAMLVNQMLLPSPDKGLMALLLLPIFIVLHLFNTCLGMFESLVQGARLNYVEFFGKFFEGGGAKFNEFKVSRRYSK